MDPIIERMLIAGLIAVLGWITLRTLIWLRLRNHVRNRLGLGSFHPGTPGILYFSSPDCLPCKTVQRPELDRLTVLLEGRLQVLEVNVYQNPKLSDEWGVLSLPTTFLIDSQGRPRHVNHGLTRAAKLLQQLRRIGELSEEAERQMASQLAVETK